MEHLIPYLPISDTFGMTNIHSAHKIELTHGKEVTPSFSNRKDSKPIK